MNQEAFRNLISSSSAVAGPSSSSSNRSFGKAHRHKATTSSTTKPSDLKPRKLKPDDSYIDRASARRSGRTDSEFTEIEALHNDFETRIAAADTEEERQKLREQISSVGGDAKHSVLVKGLDWALLAQNRARIERESGAAEGEGEGELEQAYQVGRTGDEGAGGKRNREEIVEAIKRTREGKLARSEEEEKNGTKSSLRPIGFKPIGAADKQEEYTAEYKWVNGKRMRKKKKPETAAIAEPKASREADQVKAVDDAKSESDRSTPIKAKPGPAAATATNKQQHPSASPPAKISAPSSQAQKQDATSASHSKTASQPATSAEQQSDEPHFRAPALRANEDDDDDDDEDIFADVGGWDGIPEAKDEDEEPHTETTEPWPASPPVAGQTPTPPASLPVSSTVDEVATLSEPARPVVDDLPTAEPAAESSPPHEQAPSSARVPAETLSASAPAESAADPTPPPKPKKSKWDDDDDDQQDKKKKKKKHH